MIAWLQVILNERILAPETKAVREEKLESFGGS